jgi:hypothetical protein
VPRDCLKEKERQLGILKDNRHTRSICKVIGGKLKEKKRYKKLGANVKYVVVQKNL